MKDPTGPPSPERHPAPTPQPDARILGLSVADLAGVSVDELVGNKTAVTMVMHYYKQLSDENSALRNDVNTLKTYVSGYNEKKTNARVGAVLLVVSNVTIAFGVNLLTSQVVWPGLASLVPGVVMAIAGLYFSLREPS
jgi:hypothetical protein